VETEVLIVGAGPVGLMAAIELRRRGIDVVIVDKRDDVAPWAKAVGVQPRTLEIFDAVGVARRPEPGDRHARTADLRQWRASRADRVGTAGSGAVPIRIAAAVRHRGSPCRPSGRARRHGASRVAVLDVTADEHAVNAQVRESGSETTVSADYVIGADGAHSVVRKSLGVAFSGRVSYVMAPDDADLSGRVLCTQTQT
jgi:2-polyprenyl-6-methoxyphenol hydroxylase-like FAD-dependent oxidoreductase